MGWLGGMDGVGTIADLRTHKSMAKTIAVEYRVYDGPDALAHAAAEHFWKGRKERCR